MRIRNKKEDKFRRHNVGVLFTIRYIRWNIYVANAVNSNCVVEKVLAFQFLPLIISYATSMRKSPFMCASHTEHATWFHSFDERNKKKIVTKIKLELLKNAAKIKCLIMKSILRKKTFFRSYYTDHHQKTVNEIQWKRGKNVAHLNEIKLDYMPQFIFFFLGNIHQNVI